MLQVVPLSKPRTGLMVSRPDDVALSGLLCSMHAEPPPSGHNRPYLATCSETIYDWNGRFLGSFAGVSFWGWLQVSHLHVESGPNLAEVYQQLTARLKTVALQRGCTGIMVPCFTEADQDRLACEGFHRVGKLVDYPRGYAHRVMVCRLPSNRWTMNTGVSLYEHRVGLAYEPDQFEHYLAARGLPPSSEQPINRVVHNRAGRLVAGALAEVNWHQLRLNGLWTDPDFRGRGCAGRLLRSLENEARVRKLDHILVDTFSFQALFFYQRHGYRVYATIRDFPKGHERYFLAKRL